MSQSKNASVVFNEGYIAGYNQSRVDAGDMSQEDADHILNRVAHCTDTEEPIENATNVFIGDKVRRIRKIITGRDK